MLFGVNKLTSRTQDTTNGETDTPGHPSAAPYASLTHLAQPLTYSQPTMKTAEVPYAADAELSLSFDELQVSPLLFLSPTIRNKHYRYSVRSMKRS